MGIQSLNEGQPVMHHLFKATGLVILGVLKLQINIHVATSPVFQGSSLPKKIKQM